MNTYASELGSLYSMRYTQDKTPLLPHSRAHVLHTTNRFQHSNPEPPCSTTAVLEQLFDMWNTQGILSPHEKSVYTMNSLNNFNTKDMIFKTHVVDYCTPERPIIGKLDVPAAMGFSVPYTQTTDPSLFKTGKKVPYNEAGLTIMLNGPNDYYILSPYTLPPN